MRRSGQERVVRLLLLAREGAKVLAPGLHNTQLLFLTYVGSIDIQIIQIWREGVLCLY